MTTPTLPRPPATTPDLYEQDGKGDAAIVYAHYFVGGCDWLITEYDPATARMYGGPASVTGKTPNSDTSPTPNSTGYASAESSPSTTEPTGSPAQSAKQSHSSTPVQADPWRCPAERRGWLRHRAEATHHGIRRQPPAAQAPGSEQLSDPYSTLPLMHPDDPRVGTLAETPNGYTVLVPSACLNRHPLEPGNVIVQGSTNGIRWRCHTCGDATER